MKINTAGQAPISVVLKKQLILPLCTAVVETFNKDRSTPVEFKNSDVYTNDQSKPWLDGGLFKEAMHDLLGEVSRYRDEKETVQFSLGSRGTNSWQVVISFVLCQSANEKFSDLSGYPYFISVRTRDIISQHHAKINFETKNQKANIQVSFEK